MAKINRSDYFAGVFLATILKTTKTVPLLCNAAKDSKCVEFDTNIGDFNIFIKYSTTTQDGWDRKKRG